MILKTSSIQELDSWSAWGDLMKKRAISYIIAFIVLLSVCAGEESIRGFRAVDPVELERKVPKGYGRVFVQAGRENNIDPVFLTAISAHESGQWKSKIARQKNNWMGLMSRSGPKSFGTPRESIFYAAKLLNRKPFQGRNTLSEIARQSTAQKIPNTGSRPFFIGNRNCRNGKPLPSKGNNTLFGPDSRISQVKLFLSRIKDSRTMGHLTGSRSSLPLFNLVNC